MTRFIIAAWGPLVAALACVTPALAGETAEEVLTDKGLRRSGEMYLLRDEDSVKKAADAVEARSREFRIASAREKYAVRSEAEKKTLAANLKKQYAAMKQQYDRSNPEIRAQIANLTQQRAAIRQQLDGLRYANSIAATAAWNQLANQSNALNDQIGMLTNQRNQFVETMNEMGGQLDQLTAPSDPANPGPQTGPSAEDRRDAYTKALEELRKLVDETKEKYEDLAEDTEVKGALDTLGQKSAKIKYVLGPSRKFLDTVKALEQAEARGTSEPVADSPTRATVKRKPKPTRRKSVPPLSGDAKKAVVEEPSNETDR